MVTFIVPLSAPCLQTDSERLDLGFGGWSSSEVHLLSDSISGGFAIIGGPRNRWQAKRAVGNLALTVGIRALSD